MRLPKKILSFPLFILPFLLYANLPQEKQYIYLPYKYSFCLETSDMSISIPESWGFKVSYTKDEKSKLLIQSGMVIYSSYSDSLNKANSVFFIRPEAKEPCLELRTAAFGSEQTDESTIRTNFGNFYQIDQIEEEKIPSYQLISESEVITFRILTKDEAEKELCREIISSAASCYTTYVTAHEKTEGMERHSIRYYAKYSTNYPDLGFTFITPFDMSAEIKAPKININDATTLLSAYTTLDEISEETYAGYFWENDFNMKYAFRKNTEDKESLQNSIDAFTNIYYYHKSCQQTFLYPVSGIASTIYVLGNAALPTIAVVIPTKEYQAMFLFENVSEKEIGSIDTILSQIHIADKEKEGVERMEAYPHSFTEIVNIQSLEGKMYPSVELNKNASIKKIPIIECHIPEAKAIIEIPALNTVYAYPSYDTPTINEKSKKYKITLRKDALAMGDEEFNGAVMTYDDSDYSQIILWVPENKENVPAEVYFQKQYLPYDCQIENERIKWAGTAEIKKQKWYIVIVDDYNYTSYQYITETNGTLIEIRIITPSSSEESDVVKMTETLLHKAVFK